MHPIRDIIAAIGAFWAIVIAALVALAILIGGGIWIATVTSGARGNASVTRQHNSGGNQITQNSKLLGDNATVIADQQKIKALAQNQQTEQDRIDLQGQELNCQTDVQTYNADVASILAAGLLPAGLPSSYPTTTCEVQNP